MASVLIVDDDVVIRDVLFELFDEDHLCHTAETAEQALEFLEFNHYDVVILDISLPKMSGLELLGHIRQQWPDTPVIIITGIDYKEYAGNLIRMGAFDYIAKPFQLQDAKGKLASAVLYRERWLETVKDSADRALTHGKQLMQERRNAVRHMAQRAARMRFINAPGATQPTAEGPQIQPALVGYTRDISETGLALVVPGVRSEDRNFYGAQSPLQIMLSLPNGVVEMQAAPARYQWIDQADQSKGFIIGARVTNMNEENRTRFKDFLGALP